MGTLNEFRLSQESAFLFVLSYEYRLPFPQLLGMYNLSDKVFWAYIALFTNMSKMGVRKGSQLSKMANRIYKSMMGIKDKSYVKIEVDVVDENGELVYDDKGKVLKEKIQKVETYPVILNEDELKIKEVMEYYTTKGYSNGEDFIPESKIVETRGMFRGDAFVLTDTNERYTYCTKIEYLVEKFFPEMTTSEYRALSVRELGEMLETVQCTEVALEEVV